LEKYSPLTRQLLLLRGISTEKKADVFLNPDWERDTHSPFLMKDMEKSVERIISAVNKKELIAIWSDYDMDGIPGAVVLFDFFKKIGYEKIIHYTPHRNEDGFGLNKKGIDELSDKKVNLVITIDCGISDTEQVKYLKSKKMEVIITDHHLPGENTPDAFSILNPKQKDCDYPEKMLCGAGVVFKLVQGLLKKIRNDEKMKSVAPVDGWEKWLLDMVGMATVSDMVPLVGENRVFAFYGLVVLRKSRRVGLHALLKKARASQKKLTEDDIAFTIAPRINAASRMGHASDAFKLLSTESFEEAGVLADKLEKINKDRKVLVSTMKREIKRRIKKNKKNGAVVVMGNPDWKPSLLGLVAGSLAEDCGKPVFLWGREAGIVIKGSCRSDGVCNVFELMSEVKESFIDFGGHSFAGGFSVDEESIHTLENELSCAYEKKKNENVTEEKFYDYVLSPEEVTWSLYNEAAKFAPFGQGNEKPIFLFKDVEIANVKTFGKRNEHLEISIKKNAGGILKAISFFTKKDSFEIDIERETKVSVLAHLEASFFFGKSELRLRLVDIVKNK
jgi:single-stranded-DNA-specific exonuclease